jgi:hypothetical protein
VTPSDAAAILGVALDASSVEIDGAYKRQARASHPDQFAGADEKVTRAASEQFIRVTEARTILLRHAAERRTRDRPTVPISTPVPTPGATDYAAASAVRRSAAPISTIVWGYLVVFASVFSFVAGPLPFSPWMLLVLIPTDVAAIAYARTGSRPLMIATLLLGAANAAITIAFASFGALLAFEVLLAPGIALFVLGLRTARRRLRVRR